MLLTVDELRVHIASSLSDDALRDLLDAAEADITAAAEALASAITERHSGGYATLVLDHPTGTIASVTESSDTTTPVILATDDYRVDGYILTRLTTGTHPASWWTGLVTVVHTPPDDEARRRRAQVALVRLDLSMAAGVTSERIGDYSVGYASGTSSYAQQRAAILADLAPAMAR